ncbi:MAG: hypothetical protein ACLFRP_07515 [Puniceicoccaceae bacterium]
MDPFAEALANLYGEEPIRLRKPSEVFFGGAVCEPVVPPETVEVAGDDPAKPLDPENSVRLKSP